MQIPKHQPAPSFESPQQPVNCIDHAEEKTYLMPKRKAQDTAEDMNAPAKKTKAAPKRGRKTAEESKYYTISFISIYTQSQDRHRGGAKMKMEISRLNSEAQPTCRLQLLPRTVRHLAISSSMVHLHRFQSTKTLQSLS